MRIDSKMMKKTMMMRIITINQMIKTCLAGVRAMKIQVTQIATLSQTRTLA